MELKNNSVRLFLGTNFHQCLIIHLLWCMLSTSTVLGLREQHNYKGAFQQHANKVSYVEAQSCGNNTCNIHLIQNFQNDYKKLFIVKYSFAMWTNNYSKLCICGASCCPCRLKHKPWSLEWALWIKSSVTLCHFILRYWYILWYVFSGNSIEKQFRNDQIGMSVFGFGPVNLVNYIPDNPLRQWVIR